MADHVGILTSGGDCPGLNAAIRAVGKAAQDVYGMRVTGILNGFRGLVERKYIDLDSTMLSGILTSGGTILGTSRDKPNKMPINGVERDMTATIVRNYKKLNLNALVCLGGGGTQKNALHLAKAGLNVVTLPKTIDNDVHLTDLSFGFDTAAGIATEAIDRLHSTATSHNRIIVVELMGHRAGWLTLQAGVAGGADVILIPEIPYDVDIVAKAIKRRTRRGKRFSIVAVAEGCMSLRDAQRVEQLVKQKDTATRKGERDSAATALQHFHEEHVTHTIRLTRTLEEMTGLESRLTILGHLQRGGTPSATDRVLSTRLGTTCAEMLKQRRYGIMLALQNGEIVPVPLEAVASGKKLVPPDHPLIRSAKMVGTSLGN